LSTSVNGASVQGTQAFISLCPCEPQTQLWTLKTEGHTRTVTLLKV